jgi:hypothetical protein
VSAGAAVVHISLLALLVLLVGSIPVLVHRRRARAARARGDDLLCAELRLGRDDHASPYEVSKLFDGIAGALRPGLIRRPLDGPPTLTLKLISSGGGSAVRFVVQAPSIFHPVLGARLRATYPDARLVPLDPAFSDPLDLHAIVSPRATAAAIVHRQAIAPTAVDVLRLKKARRWVWALATTKDYEHSLIEGLLAVMHSLPTASVVEFLLTPAPTVLERVVGAALRQRERDFKSARLVGPNEPGVESVVAQKQLRGAIEGVGRAWWWFDLRVIVPRGNLAYARQAAGVLQEARGDNYLRPRVMRLRRRLYAWRSARGLPSLWPALWTGALSSAELASLWHLPSLRLKAVPLHRTSAREIAATSAVCRDPGHALMRDEHGLVGLHPHDRRYGLLLLGGQGTGKTAALARYTRAAAEDASRALIVIDPKEDFARLCLGLVPTTRTVHFLDLGAPRYGLNILASGHLAPELRADIFVSLIRELAGATSVGSRSDLFLRAALHAVMVVEDQPALQHVYALLDPFDSGYREWITRELRTMHEVDFLRDYWAQTFPRTVKANPRFVAEAIDAPQNKIARFLDAPSLNLLMTHPIQLDLERIIRQREILIINGSKGAVGEDNANLFCAMVLVLIQHTLHQMQRLAPEARVQAGLAIDEAHNVFTPAFATLLSEGRSGGIEVAAAFQYTRQIKDEAVRAGVRSLLQNVSIFRQRDFSDARAAAALAMEVFQDNLRGDVEDQRRVRIDPADIAQQPDYRAVNLWLANGVPQPAATATTEPMELLASSDGAARRRRHHGREQQRRGDHPHDHGRYIQPPLVRSARVPVVARFRTLHVDLTGWAEAPAFDEITRVAVALKPFSGNPLAFTASREDASGRRFVVLLHSDPRSADWVAPGSWEVSIWCWVRGQDRPVEWHPQTFDKAAGETPMSVLVEDEPRRPGDPATSPLA